MTATVIDQSLTTMRSDTNAYVSTIDRDTRESSFHEVVSQEWIEDLPLSLVEAYARLAAGHAVTREVDPGVWVSTVVGLDGVWSDGDSAEAAESSLPGVIVGWVAVHRRLGHSGIPAIEGLDLNRRDSE